MSLVNQPILYRFKLFEPNIISQSKTTTPGHRPGAKFAARI